MLHGVGVWVGLDRSMALTYSRPPYQRGLEPSCYGVLWWWWRVFSLNWTHVRRLVVAKAWARLYIVAVVMSGVVEALTSIAWSFPRKERACSRVRWHGRLCDVGALTLNISRGSWWDIMPAALCRFLLFSNLEDKARKSRDLTGACSPISFPVTVGLGGSMAVIFNALAPVPATSGRERFCARGLPIRSTLFP